MGIIDASAKIGAKKDLLKEKVKDTYSEISDKGVSTYIGNRYQAAKTKAMTEAREDIASGKKATRIEEPKAMSSILNGLRNAGRAIGGSGDSSSSGDDGGLLLLFWIAVFAHLFDAMTNFQRPAPMVYVYLCLAIIAFFFVFKMRIGGSEEIEFFIAIALAYFLPIIPAMLPDSRWILAASGILCLLPVIPLYLGLKFPEQSFIKKASRAYMVFWVIVLAFYLMMTFAPSQNTKALVNNPMAGVKYIIAGTSSTLSGTMTTFNNAVKRAVAQATGQPYDGQEESRVGIYVENAKPLESKYNTNSDVFVEAKISGVNLKEQINVNNICYIENVGTGTASPAQLPINNNDENIIDCDMGKLKAGSYTVKIRADFEYQTTSDIQYTFVSNAVTSDQYVKLGIDEQAIATYTGGPVQLGLPSLHQPLRVNVDSGGSTQLSSYPFGVSLQNKWPQGSVVKGLNYTLDVPDEILLQDCSRNYIYTHQLQDGGTYRNIYAFSINTTNAQDIFDAVTCRMKFSDITKLLGNDYKSVKTLAASARYEYAVESSTLVIVDKAQ